MERFSYQPQQQEKTSWKAPVADVRQETTWDNFVAQAPSLYKKKEESKQIERERPQRKVVQYELSFDQQKARELQKVLYEQPDRYEEEKKQFEGYINFQLLTTLGERYNRGISEYSYRVRDGKLVGEHSDEPFEDVLIRGRDYRLENGSPLDHPREAAEVEGFQKMQEIMTDEETPDGTIVISVSPPGREGSIYKHNFYDMFQKTEDGSIKAVRFSSSLTAEETIDRLKELVPDLDTPEELSDVSLLSSPLTLGNGLTMEKIHQLLHRDHEVMSEEDFEEIKRLSDILRTSFIASLLADPDNERAHALRFNALLNGADDIADLLKAKRNGVIFERKSQKKYTERDISSLGMRAVRGVDTGCGFSGGIAMGGLSAGMSAGLGFFGVDQFGYMRPEDDPNLCRCGGDSPHFHCPGTKTIKERDSKGNEVKKKKECKYKIIVGRGTTSCPDCGEGKKC